MDKPMIKQLEVGSKWRHKNGDEYIIRFFTNTTSTDVERYPPTVVYQDNDEFLWSRPINDWHRSFVPID